MLKVKDFLKNSSIITIIIVWWIFSMMLSYFYPFSLANAISITTAFVTLWWFVWATKNIVKQRELELRTKYLEDAFYSIQKYSRYTKYNNTWKYPYDKEKLEDWLNRAFNNVKLFGTEEMIERIDILYNQEIFSV